MTSSLTTPSFFWTNSLNSRRSLPLLSNELVKDVPYCKSLIWSEDMIFTRHEIFLKQAVKNVRRFSKKESCRVEILHTRENHSSIGGSPPLPLGLENHLVPPKSGLSTDLIPHQGIHPVHRHTTSCILKLEETSSSIGPKLPLREKVEPPCKRSGRLCCSGNKHYRYSCSPLRVIHFRTSSQHISKSATTSPNRLYNEVHSPRLDLLRYGYGRAKCINRGGYFWTGEASLRCWKSLHNLCSLQICRL